MNLNHYANLIDSKIKYFLNEFNELAKKILIHCVGYTIGVSILWPLCYFIYQLWIFIIDGYWISITLSQLGMKIETEFKGINLIGDYIFELPLFFSIFFTGIFGSLTLFLIIKFFYILFFLIYKSIKEFILFFRNDEML